MIRLGRDFWASSPGTSNGKEIGLQTRNKSIEFHRLPPFKHNHLIILSNRVFLRLPYA
jgi:hypothetical protein